MPNLSFNCPHCQKLLEVPEHLVGGTIACPGCKGQISLQNAAPAQSASAPAASTPRTPPAVKQKPAISSPAKASAPIVFNCEYCNVELEADADQANTVMDCPSCEATIRIPAVGGKSALHLKKKAMTRQCPQCFAQIPVAAPVCQYCGAGANAAIQSSLNRAAARPSPSQSTGSGFPDLLKLVLSLLLLAGCIGAGIFFFKRDFTSSNKGNGAIASSSTPSATGNLFSAGKEDDQLYEYAKTKTSHAAVPEEKVEALQGYLNKFPTGRHSGEITALLEDAKKEAAKPKPFATTIVVRAFTMKGSNSPRHSITYELLVNGEKIRTLDNSSVSAEFGTVTVKAGDVISGRALWRNGYGAVGTVNETPDKAMHTVRDTDKGSTIYLQTFDGIYLEGWW